MLQHHPEVLTGVYPPGTGEVVSGKIIVTISRPQELSEDEGGV